MRDLPDKFPAAPNASSPLAFIFWLARQQIWALLGGIFFGVLWMTCQAVSPAILGRTIDLGIATKDPRVIATWCALLLGVGIVQALAGMMRHRFAVSNWLNGALRSSQLLGHHATKTGAAIKSELPTGEIVTTVATDAFRLGEVFDISARVAGSLVSYVIVAVILIQVSAPLGIAVLIGLPIIVFLMGLLVKPLQRRQATQREQTGKLTTLGADTVAGLRVLRGVGGETVFVNRYRERSQAVRREGVRVAQVSSYSDALQVLLPGLFLAGVMFFGAHMAHVGEITIGELVAFYGYASFLTGPLRTANDAFQRYARGWVAARKITDVLTVEPLVAESESPAPLPAADAILRDVESGIEVRPGAFTALVSANPDDSAAVARRFGRFDDAIQRDSPVTLGGVPLVDLPLNHLRERLIVSEATPHLFTGGLAAELDVRGTASAEQIRAALHVADADDIIDALPEGLAAHVEERGRSFSGGQRQRLALARVVLADPDTLVLIEPTSAVDAHTEARVAARLHAARTGRTTVVVSASPLMLDRADHVVLLKDGAVHGVDTHRSLMGRTDPVGTHYRSIVARGEG